MEYLIYAIGFMIGWWILSTLYKEGFVNGYNRAAHDYTKYFEEKMEKQNAK